MEQNTEEWLELRKKNIGASDAPIIMGLSPWTTKYQLWQQKLNLVEPREENEAMRRGKLLEPKAHARFREMTGFNTKPEVAFHPTIPYMMASFDGFDPDKKILVEIKCPGSSSHQMAKIGLVPENYIPQIQHQMEVVGADMAYYFSFDGENGEIVEVKRDQSMIDKIIKEEKKFYECMTTFNPPELCDRDYIKREDEEWQSAAEHYLGLQRSLQELEKQEKMAKERLILLAGQSNVKGAGISLSKTIRRGNVDYGAIEALKSINLDQYRKPATEYWTVRKG